MAETQRPDRSVLRACCYSSLAEVSTLLQRVDAYLRTAGTPPDWREDINIILAEVLSNIARHGYGNDHGRIDLEIHLGARELRCRVSDFGRAFDLDAIGHSSPEPTLLREGGYGWFLIRSLARGLIYQRDQDVNCLTFWVPVDLEAPIAAL